MKWITLIYLILNTVFYWVNYDQRDAQLICYQLSSVIFFLSGLYFPQKELKPSKLNISISILMLLFIFAWFRSMQGWNQTAFNLLLGIMVYLTVIKTINKDDVMFVIKGLGYLTIFCVAVLALQIFGWDFRGAVVRGSTDIAPESVFFQRSAMGMYFAQITPLLLIITPFSFILLIPMLWSLSVAAYLSVFIGSLFFLWYRRRIWFWVISGVLILTGIVTPFLFPSVFKKAIEENNVGIATRFTMWPMVIQDIFKKPIGYGLDTFSTPLNGGWRYYHYGDNKGFHTTIRAVNTNGLVDGMTDYDKKYFKKAIYGDGYVEWNEHPHNEYLWLGYEVGVQVWIILGFIFYFIWDRFRKSKRDVLTVAMMSVIIIFAVESMLQFPFHLSRVSNIFPFVLGIFYISTEE